MKILMVTKFVPWPPDSGGKRRSLAVVEALSNLGEVTLCAFSDSSSRPSDPPPENVRVRSIPWKPSAAKIAAGLWRTGSISSARFWDPELARMTRDEAASGVDHLQIEYTQLSVYARGISARHSVLDMHNVESVLAASYAANRRGPARIPYSLEAAALRRLEQRAQQTFDSVAVVSDQDRKQLPSETRSIVVPNGWTTTDSPLPATTEPVAAFVALMGWPPNDDAALWLCRTIWPLVREKVPDARLILVGRDPSDAVRAHHGDDVEVTGTVPDVRPYLQRARVALAPLRAGGGSRLKILEALDAGRPVVATTKGAEGLDDLIGEGLVVADDPEEIADEVARLLTDARHAESLGRRGRDAVAARHSWKAALGPLVDLVNRAAVPRHEAGTI